MSYVIVSIITLGLVFILRKPIKAFFGALEKTSKTADYYVQTACREFDTNTLKKYNKLLESGRIDPEARQKLDEIFK